MSVRVTIAVVAGLLGMLFHAMPLEAGEPTAAGLWEQTDSKGHVGGWFLIFKRGDIYEGALAKLFPKPGEDPHPICTKCPGDQKDLPSLGLVMIKGMERNGFVYDKGTILDPRDGSIYKATMVVSADGQSLTLRGYWGIPLLGKSQVWTRLPDDALPHDEIPANLLPFLPTKPVSLKK